MVTVNSGCFTLPPTSDPAMQKLLLSFVGFNRILVTLTCLAPTWKTEKHGAYGLPGEAVPTPGRVDFRGTAEPHSSIT